MNVAYIMQGDNITFTINGSSTVVNKKTHLNYKKIVKAMKAENWDKVQSLVDVSASIASFYKGKIEIRNGGVFWKGNAIHNSLTKRLVEMYRNGMPVTALIAFMKNIMENPSRTAVDELYGFLEKNDLPLTNDGCFMAYKRIHAVKSKKGKVKGFVDCYTKTINNDVGQVVKMRRNGVDDNRHNTCSIGLHFCSMGYLQAFGFGGDNPIVLVKINPRDVVSIPTDYNNSKGRCCEYEVVAVHEGDENNETYDVPVYSTS